MIAIDLSKQEVLDVDPKAIQQINFLGNQQDAHRRNVNVNTTIFFISEESEEII